MKKEKMDKKKKTSVEGSIKKQYPNSIVVKVKGKKNTYNVMSKKSGHSITLTRNPAKTAKTYTVKQILNRKTRK